jgi:hypothetical protein
MSPRPVHVIKIAVCVLRSIPPLSDQPALLVCRNLKLLNRLLDRRLLVGRIHDPDQLGWRPLEVVDGPGEGFLFGRSLGHLPSLAQNGRPPHSQQGAALIGHGTPGRGLVAPRS